MPISKSVLVDWESLLVRAPYNIADTYNCNDPCEEIEDVCPNETI